MRTVSRSSKFKRDYKRETKGRYRENLDSLLQPVLFGLMADEMLHAHYHDHNLSGIWSNYRECHIKPDLLLIYRKQNKDRLELVRLGSHSQLFSM